MAEDFVEDVTLLEAKDTLLQEDREATLFEDPYCTHLKSGTKQQKKNISEAQMDQQQEHPPKTTHDAIPIKRSHRTKKPSTHWNEEAGFLSQLPLSLAS